jgi:hypothetical protein
VENGERDVSEGARRDLEAVRPVGHPGSPDKEIMSEGEIQERRTTIGKLRTLIDKAQGGDEDAALDIRNVLDSTPDLAWLFVKGPGKLAESALLDAFIKDDDLATKELLKHQLESMRIEVAGKYPSPLERLLAERVVATWLEVQLFSGLYATGMKSGTMRQDEFRHKRLDRAHKRHLSAIRALAQVRKMGPAVQINIADKQINTSG